MNGPNLTPLGRGRKASPDVITVATCDDACRLEAARLGLDLELGHSDFEGQLIEWIHQADLDYRAGGASARSSIPGRWPHTSIALLDAIEATSMPVHRGAHPQSAPARRVPARLVTSHWAATGTIVGLGADVNRLGIQALDQIARDSVDI
jgi:3-dehydroquinate dehydratase-2